jgi:hypothetical protein
MAYRHQLSHNKVLFLESLFPTPQGIQLLSIQILQSVERSVQILGQHVLIKTTAGQASRRIAASEVCIGATRAIEVAAGCDVKDTATNREIDRHVVQAIVGEERGRGEGAEDGWRRGAWEGLRGGWFEPEIDKKAEEGEEDEVYRGEDGGAAVL